METTLGRIVVLWVLALFAGILVAVVSPQPASAFCKGENNPYSWSVGWADEDVRWTTTCDGLGDYYGKVADGATDGNCVDLYSKDDLGSPWTYEERSCTVGGWVNFSYDYPDEDAYFRVCKNNAGTCSAQQFSWGF